MARTFTLRVSDGFVETFGASLIARISKEAPGVRLRFVQKRDRDSGALRDGTADLETGVVGRRTGPEVRTQALFRDRFIGVVRTGHPLARGKLTAARYGAARHVRVVRQGSEKNPVDEAMTKLGLTRDVGASVDGFSAALALARGSDLVATVPGRHTAGLRDGLHSFPLPLPVGEITVSLLWHPRMDGDPAHRWLRGCVREVCAGLTRAGGRPGS
jgi:DNA-binding transcriptional LysR family regulator